MRKYIVNGNFARALVRVLSLAVLFLSLALVPGCAGKTGSGADGGEAGEEADEKETAAVAESTASDIKGQAARIEEIIRTITARPHSTGTEGEKKVARYIETYLAELGYETRQMSFTQEPVRDSSTALSGVNVIAVRSADDGGTTGSMAVDSGENGTVAVDSGDIGPAAADRGEASDTRVPDRGTASPDIIIVGAHHDAKPGIGGADDDASGVAVLLETARLLAEVPTDTELRFISFSGEEDGRVGSRYYAESLTAEEKERILGQIQIDEIGYQGSDSLRLCTVDGKATFLSNLLAETKLDSETVVLETEIHRDDLSDHNSFVSAGIPAVMLAQGDFAFENHSILDQADLIDPEVCAAAANYLADALKKLMDSEQPSWREEARQANPSCGYRVEKDTSLWFGNDRNFVENMMGLSGETVETGTNEYGDQTETVRYSIRWFGMDEPIPSDYYYRNGFLEEVDILYEETTGQTRQEAIEALSGFLGEPDYYGEKDGSETSWEDATYHKYTAVAPQEDGSYKVYVLDDNFGHDLKNSYSLGEELSVLEQKARETAENPEQDQKMLEMALQVVYPADRPMIELQMYTDGYHNSTGFTGGISYEDNTRMQLSLDVVDAFEEGTALWRDYNKFLKTAVHEYGHALAQNAAQVDITGQARTADDTMPPVMYDYEAFADDAYLRAFYERFWTELDVRSGLEYYKEAPEEFVDSYAATDMSEDFAETFALFVLGDRPSGNTVAEEKIRFFYDYEELTARRDFIRGNFELEN